MIEPDTIYYVKCDKCNTYLTHIFDDKFTFEEECQFDSIEQCHYVIETHGWLLTEAGSCYCPECRKEMENEKRTI